ncbi:hypothetical protein LA76x_4284 [Lysobacter antibioticus]|uniref:Uncharacterized protein n=1 Tax=Lysobacter antibioticus TaxID=84531 RepID=A0A0S2FFT7_LYSAN|nr:hypothetical protein LA76x_4284 [Lysobacter antibioticus]
MSGRRRGAYDAWRSWVGAAPAATCVMAEAARSQLAPLLPKAVRRPRQPVMFLR